MTPSLRSDVDFRVRICYLLPLLAGLALLIPAWVPHIFFYQDGSLSATVGLFDLLGYLREETSNILHADGSVAPSTYRFALLMSILTVASWFFVVWYALFAALTAALSIWAFASAPSETLNTAKRVYRTIVPNRVFYGVFSFLPLLPALMPILYARFLRTMLGTNVTVYFYGAPDWVYALVAGVVCALPFYLLLRAQKEKKTDLFRIYRL